METITGFSKIKIIGLIGAVLLLIGCFTPLISMSFLGTAVSMSLLGNKVTENGIIILALACISGVLIVANRLKWLYVTGGISVLTTGYMFLTIQSGLSNLGSKNTFSALATGIIKLDIGWAFLFLGSMLLIITAYFEGKDFLNSSSKETPTVDNLNSLEKLAELRDKNIISNEEFIEQKEAILTSGKIDNSSSSSSEPKTFRSMR